MLNETTYTVEIPTELLIALIDASEIFIRSSAEKNSEEYDQNKQNFEAALEAIEKAELAIRSSHGDNESGG